MKESTEMIQWGELIKLLEGFPERDVVKVRREMEFIRNLVQTGKMQTTEETLIEYREAFKDRLIKLDVLV